MYLTGLPEFKEIHNILSVDFEKASVKFELRISRGRKVMYSETFYSVSSFLIALHEWFEFRRTITTEDLSEYSFRIIPKPWGDE